MKRLFNSNDLIILLLIIATSCIARNLKNQTNKLSCDRAYSYLTVCPNTVYGNLSFIEPYINDCDTVIIDVRMNLSNLTNTHYFHHYRGNIITNCAPNDIYNYTVIGHAYFDDKHFNGTASMCNDDCTDIFFKGKYQLHGGNGTCYRVFTLGPVC
jgi:hypothetical protein